MTEPQVEQLGNLLVSMNVTLDDALDLILFTLGDVMSQYTDEEVNEEFFSAVCADLKASYQLNCGEFPEATTSGDKIH